MTVFSNDADLLVYEPVLFTEAALPGQVLCRGSAAQLDGTALVQGECDFTACGLEPGGVIHLFNPDTGYDKTVEIVFVDSAAQVTVSLVRGESGASLLPPGDAEPLSFGAVSYRPQARAAFRELTRFFNLRPGAPDGLYGTEHVLDLECLRTPSVYATLAKVYASLGRTNHDDEHWGKSRYYRDLYIETRRGLRIAIDTNADGRADLVRTGNSLTLNRF